MATETRNDCCGCADGCHGCGANKDYDVLVCDQCEEEFDELAEIDELELCPDCLWEYVEKRTLDA